jgi:hypothetical protein
MSIRVNIDICEHKVKIRSHLYTPRSVSPLESQSVWFLVYLLDDAAAGVTIARLRWPSLLEGRVYCHFHPTR